MQNGFPLTFAICMAENPVSFITDTLKIAFSFGKYSDMNIVLGGKGHPLLLSF